MQEANNSEGDKVCLIALNFEKTQRSYYDRAPFLSQSQVLMPWTLKLSDFRLIRLLLRSTKPLTADLRFVVRGGPLGQKPNSWLCTWREPDVAVVVAISWYHGTVHVFQPIKRRLERENGDFFTWKIRIWPWKLHQRIVGYSTYCGQSLVIDLCGGWL